MYLDESTLDEGEGQQTSAKEGLRGHHDGGHGQEDKGKVDGLHLVAEVVAVSK